MKIQKKKAKFSVGQKVWCKICEQPTKIVVRVGLGFGTSCQLRPGQNPIVAASDLLSKRPRPQPTKRGR